MVIVYTRYDAREKSFKPTLHANNILSVLGVHSLCVALAQEQESDLRE